MVSEKCSVGQLPSCRGAHIYLHTHLDDYCVSVGNEAFLNLVESDEESFIRSYKTYDLVPASWYCDVLDCLHKSAQQKLLVERSLPFLVEEEEEEWMRMHMVTVQCGESGHPALEGLYMTTVRKTTENICRAAWASLTHLRTCIMTAHVSHNTFQSV